jgi:GNAT superfamily N-acetyltransferase
VPDYKAGETVRYRITWLEMTARPGYGWPRLPVGREALLVRADTPPWWYFLALYDAVGRDHAWTDRHADSPAALNAWLADPQVSLHSLMSQGWPQGFFMIDGREEGVADLAYFGLVPEALGRGMGWWLLQTAILTAWQRPGITRLTVNTCTLDHPRALGQYQRAGFTPVRTAEAERVLKRDLSFAHPLL